MRLRPKMLLDRLSSTATARLEAAATMAAGSGHSEVTLEHALLAFIETEEGIELLSGISVDVPTLSKRLTQHLGTVASGKIGNPVFGQRLFPWMEDAWLCASVEGGATELTPAHMIAQFFREPIRYSTLGVHLDPIDDARLRLALSKTPSSSEEAPSEGAMGEAETYLTDLTERAREGHIDPIFGRDREVRQMMDILMRRRKNNPMLVGEPGVGKTALAEGLARAIADGEVPDLLADARVLSLDLAALEAGASVRGEFERRLRSVIDAVKASPTDVILFIDEAHRLVGAGGSEGTGDAANLLKPALARGELRTIGATTWAEYKKYIEKDAALVRRFQTVKVEEPNVSDAIDMLRGISRIYEESHGIQVRNEALVAAVELSERYLPERKLPDKAIDVLDTTLARLRVGRAAKPQSLLAAIGRLHSSKQEAETLSREETTDEPSDALQACLKRVAAEEATVESGTAIWTSQVEEGKDAVFEVDAMSVAETISSWTGVPLGSMQQDFGVKTLKFEDEVADRILGQEDALSAVGDALRIAHAGIRDQESPVAVLLLAGPSGVGKTETARAVSDLLYSGDRSLISINLSEFQERHTLSRLVGSPPGYVGYGEGGLLTEAVRQKPYSVVLLDECEKAHPDIMNAFYEMFDRGRLRDGQGRDVDFRNTVILLTSNLGSQTLEQLHATVDNVTFAEQAEAIHPELEKRLKPALLARMNVVPFRPLGPELLKKILGLRITGMQDRVRDAHGIELTVTEAALENLSARCTTSSGGARRIEHILQTAVAPMLAKEIIEIGLMGDTVGTLEIGLDEEGGYQCQRQS